MEGMAFRLVPEKRKGNDEFIEPNILRQILKKPLVIAEIINLDLNSEDLNDPKSFLMITINVWCKIIETHF
jgi:predicted permease